MISRVAALYFLKCLVSTKKYEIRRDTGMHNLQTRRHGEQAAETNPWKT